MGLHLELLGPPRVIVDDHPLVVDTRKAVAVLALVAVDGPQRRGALAALLWPESETARARAALRRTLSVLARGLGRRWLVLDRESVSLSGADLRCDVAEATALMTGAADGDRHARQGGGDRRADLRRAVGLHRGPFLADFGLRDAPGFDDWRAGHEEHCRRQECTALDELSRAEVAAGDLDAARDALERWLAADPLNERVHAKLMMVDAWRGDRAAAVARYRTCVTTLDRDLGVPPLARTSELYRAIIEDRVPPRPGPGSPVPADGPVDGPVPVGADLVDERPSAAAARVRDDQVTAAEATTRPVSRWPLVGRDAELADLAARFADGTRLITVIGEAGVGKTALVEAAVEAIATDGTRTVTARCEADAVGLAFGPVVELLRRAVGDAPRRQVAALPRHDLAEVARLVPDLVGDLATASDVPALDSPGAQVRFFRAIWDVLEALLADGRPGLIVIDELHAVDPVSRELLAFGLRRSEDPRIVVFACARPEDLDAPTWELVDRAGAVTHVVELGRLDTDAVRSIVAARGHDDVEGLTTRIHDESEGLPLLVVEYLRLIEGGEGEGAGEDGDDGRWALPRGARELARSRLRHLSATARQIGSAGAVIGRSFDFATVQRASGRTDEELVDGLEELIARGLISEAATDTGVTGYHFVHDKLRAAIYDETSGARRRLLHGRVADALAGDRRRHDLAAVIGEHARLGGRDGQAATWFERAGDQHRALFANAAAAAHYERALAADPPDTSGLHAKLGSVRMLTGEYARAVEHLEIAAATANDDAQLARIEHQLGSVHLRLGELDSAVAHLEAARGSAGATAALVARATCDLGLAALRSGDLSGAAAHAGEALKTPSDDIEALAQGLNLTGVVARHRQDLGEARYELGRSAALAERLDDPTAYVAALNNLALATADAGDTDAAIALLERAITLGVSHGDRHREAALRGNFADVLHQAGREDEAMAALKEAVAIFAELGTARERPEIWQLVEW